MLWARPNLLQTAVGGAPVLEEALAQRFLLLPKRAQFGGSPRDGALLNVCSIACVASLWVLQQQKVGQMLLLARVESRTYKAEAATAAASWARPFAFLADFPQASDFKEAETSLFQQVGFQGGPDDVVCFKFGEGGGGGDRLKANEINVPRRVCKVNFG